MPRKIMLIEDEATIADNIQFTLEQEGFSFLWYSEGYKGLTELSENSCDLLVLDIGLPDINGFELLKRVRAFSKIPVIILTARSDEVDKILGLEIGADDYMVKPFSARELAARIKAVLRRQADSSAGSKIFVVDENRKSISFKKVNLHLSRYEYQVLELLLKKPGWVFSREQIMSQIWDEPEESFERTVDTHIKTLRAKLKEIDSTMNPIITHRSMGYSIQENL